VAGKNFGCGSAMEVAATVILGAGIHAVLAESFSRTFFRNAINNGLIPIQCDTGTMNEGDRLAIDIAKGIVSIRNLSTCIRESVAFRLPEIMLAILEKGGIVPYLREYRTFASHPIADGGLRNAD
jgi:3-isopropylmalate/(R)-2-methylmalate dehydratase small subunit